KCWFGRSDSEFKLRLGRPHISYSLLEYQSRPAFGCNAEYRGTSPRARICDARYLWWGLKAEPGQVYSGNSSHLQAGWSLPMAARRFLYLRAWSPRSVRLHQPDEWGGFSGDAESVQRIAAKHLSGRCGVRECIFRLHRPIYSWRRSP